MKNLIWLASLFGKEGGNYNNHLCYKNTMKSKYTENLKDELFTKTDLIN